jgi:hypothetical protein
MPDQVRVFFDTWAHERGEPADEPAQHPELLMEELGTQSGFKVVGAVARTIDGCWWFWIEYWRMPEAPRLPPYIHIVDWLPVGTV